MNAATGLRALGPGALSIRVDIADARICSVRIDSTRPTHLTRLFIGRAASEAPVLAERLHALCGLSHAIASMRAIAAARGEAGRPQRGRAQDVALLCERVSETLRSSMTFALDGGAPSPAAAEAIRPLREILSLARDLAALAMADRVSTAPERAIVGANVNRMRLLLRELGFPHGRRGSWAHLLREQASCAGSFDAAAPDALEPEDDAAILDALRRGGEDFAAAPMLPGRTPETGAFARHWRRTTLADGGAAARLEARAIDLADCLDQLARSAAGDDPNAGDVHAIAPAPREGFAALETARGRLCHWTRLARDDRIDAYAIVAPTEWNFHPAGPFVAAVLGARVAPGAAERAIARLAGLFDPCVLFRVDAREPADA